MALEDTVLCQHSKEKLPARTTGKESSLPKARLWSRGVGVGDNRGGGRTCGTFFAISYGSAPPERSIITVPWYPIDFGSSVCMTIHSKYLGVRPNSVRGSEFFGELRSADASTQSPF